VIYFPSFNFSLLFFHLIDTFKAQEHSIRVSLLMECDHSASIFSSVSREASVLFLEVKNKNQRTCENLSMQLCVNVGSYLK
jgi:hypothetical protein